jgi:hypothetical protein
MIQRFKTLLQKKLDKESPKMNKNSPKLNHIQKNQATRHVNHPFCSNKQATF